MADIRAFVGHSFTKEDEEVVGKFLKYFDRLKSVFPNFSWSHAEPAEAEQLPQKVMKQIEGKNVFIGICTKKELAIAEINLSIAVFPRDVRKAKVSAFSWKTSDWIIQEIGLAIGRGLSLILLLEEGVKNPGGLQGAIEFIPFDRRSPEKSFEKILEMVGALAASEVEKTVAASVKTSESPESSENPSHAKNADWMIPQSGWNRTQYEQAIFDAILLEDDEKGQIIDKAYLATSHANDPINVATWEAYKEQLRLKFTKTGQLQRLKDLAQKHSSSGKIAGYLASVYAEYDAAKAASQYDASAEIAADPEEKAKFITRSAIQYHRAGNVSKIAAVANDLRSMFEAKLISEIYLLRSLRDLAEASGNKDVLISVLERTVAIAPEDTNARFSVAYQHSRESGSDLALHHYLKIPFHERTAATWNNLGVAFDHFSLNGKAVRAYRMSEEMGNTLAMSNLAQKFISEGFMAEAQATCDNATTVEDYDKNVLDKLTKLRDWEEKENKKQDDLLNARKPKIEFYKRLGDAVARPQIRELSSEWIGPDCKLEVSISEASLTFSGKFQRDINPLSLAIMGTSGIGRKTNHTTEYVGKVFGQAIYATIKRSSDGPKTLLSEAFDAGVKVLMYLDGAEILAMENPDSVEPKFYTLRPVN